MLKKEAAGFEEASQQIGAAIDYACSFPQPRPDFPKRGRGIICHDDAAVEMSPYVFDGVEFGSIRRQPFELQLSILNGLRDMGKSKTAFMGGQTIPEEDNPSSKLAMQHPQIARGPLSRDASTRFSCEQLNPGLRPARPAAASPGGG